MVLPVRIELTTSALPRMRSTTELRQHVRAKSFGDAGPMAAARALCQGRSMSEKDKAERLAAKLRENLRRRKAQAREMDRKEAVMPDLIRHPPSSDSKSN